MYPFIPTKASEVKEGELYFIPLSNGTYVHAVAFSYVKRKVGKKINVSLLACTTGREKNIQPMKIYTKA